MRFFFAVLCLAGTVDGKIISYEQMFSDNKTFVDGSPFGVEVTE